MSTQVVRRTTAQLNSIRSPSPLLLVGDFFDFFDFFIGAVSPSKPLNVSLSWLPQMRHHPRMRPPTSCTPGNLLQTSIRTYQHTDEHPCALRSRASTSRTHASRPCCRSMNRGGETRGVVACRAGEHMQHRCSLPDPCLALPWLWPGQGVHARACGTLQEEPCVVGEWWAALRHAPTISSKRQFQSWRSRCFVRCMRSMHVRPPAGPPASWVQPPKVWPPTAAGWMCGCTRRMCTITHTWAPGGRWGGAMEPGLDAGLPPAASWHMFSGPGLSAPVGGSGARQQSVRKSRRRRRHRRCVMARRHPPPAAATTRCLPASGTKHTGASECQSREI